MPRQSNRSPSLNGREKAIVQAITRHVWSAGIGVAATAAVAFVGFAWDLQGNLGRTDERLKNLYRAIDEHDQRVQRVEDKIDTLLLERARQEAR